MKLLDLVTNFINHEARIQDLEKEVAYLKKELEYHLWQDRKGDRKP